MIIFPFYSYTVQLQHSKKHYKKGGKCDFFCVLMVRCALKALETIFPAQSISRCPQTRCFQTYRFLFCFKDWGKAITLTYWNKIFSTCTISFRSGGIRVCNNSTSTLVLFTIGRDGRVQGILEVSRSFGDRRFKRCGVISTPDIKRCTLTENDR